MPKVTSGKHGVTSLPPIENDAPQRGEQSSPTKPKAKSTPEFPLLSGATTLEPVELDAKTSSTTMVPQRPHQPKPSSRRGISPRTRILSSRNSTKVTTPPPQAVNASEVALLSGETSTPLRTEPLTGPGAVKGTRVAIETEMATVSVAKAADARALIALKRDPKRNDIPDMTLVRSRQMVSLMDEQTKSNIELPIFSVELERGQGAESYFLELATGPIELGSQTEGIELNRALVGCWLKACQQEGGKRSSLGAVVKRFNGSAKKLGVELELTPGGKFLDSRSGGKPFSVASKEKIVQSLPSQANLQIPFGNVGKPSFLSLFDKAAPAKSFAHCQTVANTFVDDQFPSQVESTNLRSLFTLYFFHLSRLDGIMQRNHKDQKSGNLSNEKDILNCLCKAPINDLIRIGLGSDEKAALFAQACLPDVSEGVHTTWGLNPSFDAALNRALTTCVSGKASPSSKEISSTTANRNKTFYFASNPNDIFVPSSRYESVAHISELDSGKYGDCVSKSGRDFQKSSGWGRHTPWTPDVPFVMTDNPIEPIMVDQTVVAVWEQRSRRSAITNALLPSGTGESSSQTRGEIDAIVHQLGHRE